MDVTTIINQTIEDNYEEMLRQAKIKLPMSLKKDGINERAGEVVHEVLFYLLNRIANGDTDTFERLIKQKKLKNYIFSVLNSNCRKFESPYIRERLKQIEKEYNNVEIDDINDVIDESEEVKNIDELDDYLATKVRELLNDKHNTLNLELVERKLFTRYIEDDMSGHQMAKEFNVSSAYIYKVLKRTRLKIYNYMLMNEDIEITHRQ